MSDYQAKWERVDEDSPDRCQYIMSQGQCRNKKVEHSEYCPAHGGHKAYQAKEQKELRNYRLNQFKQRVGELTNSDGIFSLRQEIGVLRLLIEHKINQCTSTTDLLLVAGPLSDLAMKVERVTTSCGRLDIKLGRLLDTGKILQFAQTIIQIVSDEIDALEILEKISTRILGAIDAQIITHEAIGDKKLHNYRLNQFQQRVDELTNSDGILSLREEIGVLRMLIEHRINQCTSTTDLLLVAGPLSDLLMKVERVVTSCSRLDMKLGRLLDKGKVLQFAQTMVQIVSEEIEDNEVLEKISTRILGAIDGQITV